MSRSEHYRLFATAGPRPSAVTATGAMGANIASFYITRVVIGTVQSVGPPLVPSGLPSGRRSFCRFPIFTSCSLCRNEIGRLALQNPRRLYGILFQAASETLLTIAADPKHLGASIGFLAIAVHLGSKSSSSPASALRRARRRALSGWLPMDRLS